MTTGEGGRRVLVTGASSGIGLFAAEQLAAAGAEVVLGCRSRQRADEAVATVLRAAPAARVSVLQLDLADLASVRAAASALEGGLDAVVCNAGVTGSRRRRTTADGLELMMGTNVVGHFALLAGVVDRLRPGGRVVVLGSLAHLFSPLTDRVLGDLQAEHGYASLRQYGRSKTALMTLALELDRRFAEAGSGRIALAAHPGYAVDALSPERPGSSEASGRLRGLARPFAGLVQGKDAGARPVVHAALDDDVRGGDYWGPGGMLELRGEPARARVSAHVVDRDRAARLWASLEHTTGIGFPA